MYDRNVRECICIKHALISLIISVFEYYSSGIYPILSRKKNELYIYISPKNSHGTTNFNTTDTLFWIYISIACTVYFSNKKMWQFIFIFDSSNHMIIRMHSAWPGTKNDSTVHAMEAEQGWEMWRKCQLATVYVRFILGKRIDEKWPKKRINFKFHTPLIFFLERKNYSINNRHRKDRKQEYLQESWLLAAC